MRHRQWRPCGACAVLVHVDTGCVHWDPNRSVKAADSAARRLANRQRRESARARVAEFQRVMTPGAAAALKLREDARARVAEFQRATGRSYT